jgi:hypothetical protein
MHGRAEDARGVDLDSTEDQSICVMDEDLEWMATVMVT